MKIAFLLVACALHASWYEEKLEGWYYFQEKENEAPASPDDAEETLALEKMNLSKLLSLALLNPSEGNVENYIREQRRWIQQSTQFADAWGKVLLAKPTLGDFLINPTTQYGVQAKRDLDLGRRKDLLQRLSQDHFLLFFFRGNDPLSEKAADVALLFASIHHWKIKAISLDGKGLKNMEFELDKGISDSLGVEASPSFFVVNPFENQIFPVGAGLISVTELEQNIEMQYE